jgi:hypothetical protein
MLDGTELSLTLWTCEEIRKGFVGSGDVKRQLIRSKRDGLNG